MEPYKNLFKEKTESELILLYKQFLESEKAALFRIMNLEKSVMNIAHGRLMEFL